MDRFSVCLAGAGVIGLAIARQLAISGKYPASSILLLEQESSFGQHVSSRNSEVIHAGIYYPPGSLKAQFCVEGRQRLYQYCETYGIAYKRTGKCIVSQEDSTDGLESLLVNARNNDVADLEMWDRTTLARHEPAVSANHALYSPSTGILDSHGFMQSLLSQAEQDGTIFVPRTRIREVRQQTAGFVVETENCGSNDPENYRFEADCFINCSGLEAQSLATRIEGVRQSSIPALHLCKGDYFRYKGRNPFHRLIYPLPEPDTVGLGIHSSQDLSGQLRFGPDADYVGCINYAIESAKSIGFTQSIQRYFPGISAEKLEPDYSGIRPRLARSEGAFADFIIQKQSKHGVENLIQLFGIESPGLTASLAIARHIESLVQDSIAG